MVILRRLFTSVSSSPPPSRGYVAFAKSFPFTNNIVIATVKTSAADLVAQMMIEGKSFDQVDWKRNCGARLCWVQC
jgi:hypothetical protein